jgi:hypothetical protein
VIVSFSYVDSREEGYTELNPKYPTMTSWKRKGKIGHIKVKIMFPMALKII